LFIKDYYYYYYFILLFLKFIFEPKQLSVEGICWKELRLLEGIPSVGTWKEFHLLEGIAVHSKS